MSYLVPMARAAVRADYRLYGLDAGAAVEAASCRRLWLVDTLSAGNDSLLVGDSETEVVRELADFHGASGRGWSADLVDLIDPDPCELESETCGPECEVCNGGA